MKIIFFLIFFIISNNLIAQIKEKDIETYYTITTEVVNKIISFLDIDYQKFLISKKFKENYCNLLIDEYVNGKNVKRINLREEIKGFDNAIYIADNLVNNKFPIEIISMKINDSLLKVKTVVGNLAYNLKFKLNDSLPYSWKQLENTSKKDYKIKTDSLLSLLTFTSPIGEKFTNYPGNFEFCRINNEFVPFKDWYNKLGIQHYFIFSLQFEK